jgi:hypothetical protein
MSESTPKLSMLARTTSAPPLASKRIGAGGSEDGSTLLADALDVLALEGNDVAIDDTAPAVPKADELLGCLCDLRSENGHRG